MSFSHVRGRHGVADPAQAYIGNPVHAVADAGSLVAPSAPSMSREQYELWTWMFAGSTIRDLRHIRDVPRAAIPLGRWRPLTRRLPLRELEGSASAAHART